MSSNIIRNTRTFLNAVSDAGASESVETDHRFKEVNERCYAGTLTTGDSIEVQVSFDNSTWFTYATVTDTSFTGLILGPWPYIRFNKVGTAGAATVVAQV